MVPNRAKHHRPFCTSSVVVRLKAQDIFHGWVGWLWMSRGIFWVGGGGQALSMEHVCGIGWIEYILSG